MSESARPAELDRKVIRETLAGYAVAAEVIEQERIERLRRLSPRESWSIFVELVEGGKAFIGDPTSLKVFELERLDNLLFVRRTFDRLALSQGLQ